MDPNMIDPNSDPANRCRRATRPPGTRRCAQSLPADQQRALALATRHINASTSVAIRPDTLLAALRSGATPPRFAHHVFAFLDETDTATMADLVISGAVTYAHLAALADRLLTKRHATRTWLDDRRAL